jgi:hypothetical protein
MKVGGSDVQSEGTCNLFGSCCDMLRHLQQANAAVLLVQRVLTVNVFLMKCSLFLTLYAGPIKKTDGPRILVQTHASTCPEFSS